MDSIQMTIVLSLVYFAFVVWGYSKNSPSKTLTDATPEPDCGYINYFPELEMDDEEELSILNSSSSSSESVQTEPDWSMFTDAEFVLAFHCEMVYPETTPVALAVLPDPWDNEAEVVPASMELEFNQCQLEYQLALPPAKEVGIVVVAKPIANESHVDYDKAEHHLMLSLMTIRQLKAEAKRVKLPRYGKMTKAELLSALKVFNTNA